MGMTVIFIPCGVVSPATFIVEREKKKKEKKLLYAFSFLTTVTMRDATVEL
jgi:hypothetical protein